MNKGELVGEVARLSGLSKKDSERALDGIIQAVQEALVKGDKVTLVGFGTFEARERQAREGRNPRSGEKMTIPATKVPVFSAGKQFKSKVSGDGETDEAA